MTMLVILSPSERNRFDSPPNYKTADQTIYFALNNDILHMLNALRTVTNKVGFLLQLGYFKSQGKFYTASQFRQHDINYVNKLLKRDANQLNFSKYQKRIPALPRKKILAYLGWMPLSQHALEHLYLYFLSHAKNQLAPKQIFLMAIDYCWQNKLEVPSYNQIALLLTQAYNENEAELVAHLKKLLNHEQRELLMSLVSVDDKNKEKFQRPPITLLKQDF